MKHEYEKNNVQLSKLTNLSNFVNIVRYCIPLHQIFLTHYSSAILHDRTNTTNLLNYSDELNLSNSLIQSTKVLVSSNTHRSKVSYPMATRIVHHHPNSPNIRRNCYAFGCFEQHDLAQRSFFPRDLAGKRGRKIGGTVEIRDGSSIDIFSLLCLPRYPNAASLYGFVSTAATISPMLRAV